MNMQILLIGIDNAFEIYRAAFFLPLISYLCEVCNVSVICTAINLTVPFNRFRLLDFVIDCFPHQSEKGNYDLVWRTIHKLHFKHRSSALSRRCLI